MITQLDDNIAAVSAEFHAIKERYEEFYARFGEGLGGFPGIWHYCAELGAAFDHAENEFLDQNPRLKEEGNYVWIDSVTEFVECVYRSDDTLSTEAMQAFALLTFTEVLRREDETISNAKEPEKPA